MSFKRSPSCTGIPPGAVTIFLRPSDAAFVLGVSRQSIWRRIKRGTLESVRFMGGEWVFLKWDGLSWHLAPVPKFDGPVEACHIEVPFRANGCPQQELYAAASVV
jgi:hypothetical protein